MPQFTHDSECDRFLGTEEIDGTTYDLYVCDSQDTYIARYGDDGSDYISGKEFVGINEPITRAYTLANG